MKIPVLIFVLALAVFFRDILFQGYVFGCCDNLTINIPGKLWLVEAFRHHELPLWNPHILSGMPLLADLNLGLLSPLSVIYFLFTPYTALSIEILLSYAVALVGMFILLRSLSYAVVPSAFSAIVFTFSGTLSTISNNVSQLRVISLLPWVVWSFSRYLEDRKRSSLLMSVATVTIQFISGHPQITYYTIILLILLTLKSTTGSFQKRMRLLCVVCIFSATLSAVQLLPFLELISHSSRITMNVNSITAGALSLYGIVGLLVPASIGNLSGNGAWANQGMLLGYIGIVPLMLCIFSWRFIKASRFWFIVGLVALLASFGPITPVYWILYYVVPGMAYFRTPSLMLVVYTFAVAIVSAQGLNALTNSQKSERVRIFGMTTTILAFAVLVGGIAFWVPEFQKTVIQILPISVFTSRGIQPLHIMTMMRDLGNNLVLIGIVSIGVYITVRRYSTKIFSIFVLMATVVELFIYSSHSRVTVDRKTILSSLDTSPMQFLQTQVDANKHRVFVEPSAITTPLLSAFPKYQYRVESLWQAFAGKPNIWSLKYPTADGYSSLVLDNYNTAIDSKSTEPTGVRLRWDNPMLDLLGVSYIVLSNDEFSTVPERRFSLVRKYDHISLVANLHACEKIYSIVNGVCSREGVSDIQTFSNSVTASVVGKVQRYIVLADVWYPGWKVFVDGHEAKLEKYAGVFKSVSVPSGSHTVEFIYKPISIYAGMLITAAGASLFLALLFNELLKNIRSRQNSTSTKEER